MNLNLNRATFVSDLLSPTREKLLTNTLLDLESQHDLKVLRAQWKFGSGWIPGQPNEGLVAQTKESPALLADYDDSDWEILSDVVSFTENSDTGSQNAPGIRKARSIGLTFGWYRITITLPETIGGKSITGDKVWLETKVDDYGEVWVDAEPMSWQDQFDRGRPGVITGIRAPSRILVSESADPGTEHVISILAVNGPIGRPGGGIYLIYARLVFE